jgi:hypothetical protein
MKEMMRKEQNMIVGVYKMKPKKTTIYECPKCGDIYGDEEQAVYCCGSPDSRDGWACGECGDVYDDREDALKCCK